MRFSYFERLSAKDKRIYLRSDEIRTVKVPDVASLLPFVAELRATLEAGKRIRATRAANTLVLALCKQLGAPKVRVRIHETRPSWDGGELHGLYTFALEDGEVPEIEVWMRTVAKGQIVKFRTFMRTLLHEVAHHLDATIFEMPESFHTHGFFARESSMTKQLLGENVVVAPPKPVHAPKPVQLDLFATASRRRTPTRGE